MKKILRQALWSFGVVASVATGVLFIVLAGAPGWKLGLIATTPLALMALATAPVVQAERPFSSGDGQPAWRPGCLARTMWWCGFAGWFVAFGYIALEGARELQTYHVVTSVVAIVCLSIAGALRSPVPRRMD